MAESLNKADQGAIVKKIEIKAPVNAIWKALTDAKELVRWLPLHAKVKSGKGGSMVLSWGSPVIEESTIEVWEPNRHLRLKEVRPFGAPFAPQAAKSQQRTVDYKLESHRGSTTVQLTHSGFGIGQNLSTFRNSVAACWDFQLQALDIYTSRHLGQNRSVAWSRAVSQHSFPETWKRVTGAQGLVSEGSLQDLGPGDHYSFTTANGETFSGEVLTYQKDKQFGGTEENRNGILRIVLDHCSGRPEATVWLATYSSDKRSAANLESYREVHLLEHSITHLLQNALS